MSLAKLQGLINRVLASPKASSYIIGLVGIYLTVWELAHICQVSVINSKYDWAYETMTGPRYSNNSSLQYISRDTCTSKPLKWILSGVRSFQGLL